MKGGREGGNGKLLGYTKIKHLNIEKISVNPIIPFLGTRAQATHPPRLSLTEAFFSKKSPN